LERSGRDKLKLMATKTIVTPEEYLRMSFDGLDRELVDGEVVERNVGDKQHAKVQGRLVLLFGLLARKQPLFCYPELRLKLAATRYRVPDLAVFGPDDPAEDVPSIPPLIVIEIVSPDDRHSEILAKLEDHRIWGVPNVWLVDPRLKKLYVWTEAGLESVSTLAVPRFAVNIAAAELFA
jgi:Uma2 family endonuclease